MTDIVSSAARSRMMSGIRGANTRPEIAVRSFLHGRGFRFRLHRRDLPGRPDIVLTKWNAAVFVNGCFWHRHAGCKYATMPSDNRTFWRRKLLANRKRDVKVVSALRDSGWRVAVVWECVFRQKKGGAPKSLERLAKWIRGRRSVIEFSA